VYKNVEIMKHPSHSLLGSSASKATKPGARILICEREGKSLYQSDTPDYIVQAFTSTNGVDRSKSSSVKSNGFRSIESLRNEISSYLFEYLEGFHIPTHFVSKLSPTEMKVRWSDLVPLTIRIFNVSDSDMARRLGLREHTTLEFPVIEHYYNSGFDGVSWVNEFHVYALAIATPEEFKQINRIASKVNAVLRSLCERRHLGLAEVRLVFGRHQNQIVLGDELSPLTCRFLDMAIDDPAKRDRFMLQQENANGAITELCDRLMLKA
jgi:phosphoribosylaminoimidazole-succinocarboxamide synthase